jgi:hypothetical protein
MGVAYALETTVVVEIRDPRPRGGPLSVATVGWSLVEVDGADALIHACGVATEPALGARTTYPPGFLAAVADRRATLAVDGDRLALGPWSSVLGAADDDGDGHPGVTVRVEHALLGAGEVYVAQTTTTRLEGAVDADGTARGPATVETAQVVLGASTWWLRLPTRPRPVPDASVFRLIPIAETSCEAVTAAVGR